MAWAFRALQLSTINWYKKQWHALSTDDDKKRFNVLVLPLLLLLLLLLLTHSASSRWIFIYIFEDDILFEILISGCKPISRRWKTHEMAEEWEWESSLPTQSAMDNGPAIQKIWYTYTAKPHTTHHLLMHYVSGRSIGRLLGHCIPFIVRISQHSFPVHIYFCLFTHANTHTRVYTHRIT